MTSTTTSSELLDAALGYGALGWWVFPCRPGAKRPATKNGLHAATTDQDTIGAWWGQHPGLNIGVACGPSGLLVVDLDERPPVSGVTNFFQLVADAGHPADVATRTHDTPSDGGHLLYRAPPGVTLPSTAGKLAPGVDTRGDGGYALLPPSRLANGVYKVWDDAPILDTPAWLVDLLTATPAPPAGPIGPAGSQRSAYGARALDAELGRLAQAVEGQRNDTLIRAAFRCGQLAGGGELDPVDAATALHAVAVRVGLADREVEATIRSGLRAGATRPRSAA